MGGGRHGPGRVAFLPLGISPGQGLVNFPHAPAPPGCRRAAHNPGMMTGISDVGDGCPDHRLDRIRPIRRERRSGSPSGQQADRTDIDGRSRQDLGRSACRLRPGGLRDGPACQVRPTQGTARRGSPASPRRTMPRSGRRGGADAAAGDGEPSAVAAIPHDSRLVSGMIGPRFRDSRDGDENGHRRTPAIVRIACRCIVG